MPSDITSLNRVGQINNTGDVTALFRDQFDASLKAEYDAALIYPELVMLENLPQGYKAKEYTLRKRTASGKYHVAGEALTGSSSNKAKRLISIDAIFYEAVWLDYLDVLEDPYSNEMAEIQKDLGRALAERHNQMVVREIIKGSTASSPVTGRDSGSVISSDALIFSTTASGASATKKDQAAAIYSALLAAKTKLMNKNITGKMYCVLRPEAYMSLYDNFDFLNEQYGAQGTIQGTAITMLAGFNLIPDNQLPKTNILSSEDAYHYVDASKTVGIIFNYNSAMSIVLQPPTTIIKKMDENLATLMAAWMAAGAGWYYPETIIQLASETLTNADEELV